MTPRSSLLRPGLLALLAALAVTGCGGGTSVDRGPYTLDRAGSVLSFTTTKNAAVTESHTITTLTGALSRDGLATLSLALDSVETRIPIRNERMREHLFNTPAYPTAEISTRLNPKTLRQVDPGQTVMLPVDLMVELHGQTQTLPAELLVTRADAGTLLATTREPVIVQASQFGLLDGIATLRQLAGLSSITPSVGVNVSLRYVAE